eukprot:6213002-Lingulodinium_polyedra.AAC.1
MLVTPECEEGNARGDVFLARVQILSATSAQPRRRCRPCGRLARAPRLWRGCFPPVAPSSHPRRRDVCAGCGVGHA